MKAFHGCRIYDAIVVNYFLQNIADLYLCCGGEIGDCEDCWFCEIL